MIVNIDIWSEFIFEFCNKVCCVLYGLNFVCNYIAHRDSTVSTLGQDLFGTNCICNHRDFLIPLEIITTFPLFTQNPCKKTKWQEISAANKTCPKVTCYTHGHLLCSYNISLIIQNDTLNPTLPNNKKVVTNTMIIFTKFMFEYIHRNINK